MTSVLEVNDLSIGYNSHLAVDNISFDVQEGDLLGIVGPNGAGKTTLFRAILGFQHLHLLRVHQELVIEDPLQVTLQ